MKENRIKLLALFVLALLFMLAFTCCVSKDIDSEVVGQGKVTLFMPPESKQTETVTEDPYNTTVPIITMPPQTSGIETTQTPPVSTTVTESARPDDTVYSGFSGLY